MAGFDAIPALKDTFLPTKRAVNLKNYTSACEVWRKWHLKGAMKPKRKKPFSANNASRKALEAAGWTVGKVDQSINTGKFVFTRDLFGFADLLAMSPSRGVLLVQATADASTSNCHKRVAKLRAEPRHAIALASGIRIQVHSWEGRGSKRECRILEITSPVFLR